MSAVYNPEADTMAEIERLELEAKQLRRSIEHCTSDEDRRVLQRQLNEIKEEVGLLQARLPH
jgi:urease accessory protein UreE